MADGAMRGCPPGETIFTTVQQKKDTPTYMCVYDYNYTLQLKNDATCLNHGLTGLNARVKSTESPLSKECVFTAWKKQFVTFCCMCSAV